MSKLYKRIKNGFIRIWLPSEVLFSICFGAFCFGMAVIVSLQLVGISGVAMTYFWIFAGVTGLFALLTLIRIHIEPKDTRLNDLNDKFDKLNTKIDGQSTKIENLPDKKTILNLIKSIEELTKEIKKH